MAGTLKVNERLAALTAAGTSVWLDQMRRSLVEGGELQRLIEESCLRGVTSNPAIFEKAILGSEDYDDQLAELARSGASVDEVYEQLVLRDVRGACDVLRPVWEANDHKDGFVSLEVAPSLARNGDATTREARRFWSALDRPNAMIKIPGTPEGIASIEQATYEGTNVNVTLLFSVEAYTGVAEAYIRGMERRLDEGLSLDVHSVASFFVSRVDTEVDKRLDALGRPDLKGRAGLANARAAYTRFKEIFRGERFARLREAGAPVQRPLWASTGVKNPEYRDTMYVEGLVGPDTVNTMPMATLLAAADHATIDGPTAEIDPTPDLEALAAAGIDMHDVTDVLLDQGIEAFVTPMRKLLAGIESKREAIVTGRPATIQASLPDELEPAVARRVRRAQEEDVARRIWSHDVTLWAPEGTPEIADRLGWLTIAEEMEEAVPELEAFAREVASDFSDCAVLGMGGSSLAPEVLRQSFPPNPDALALHVLDSTDAGAVRAFEGNLALDRTLFVVSTKSGGTIETLSLFEHFWRATGGNGAQFVAITDPGSSLEALAHERGFRRVFLADPNIGGRYSALSHFGLVPAALAGIDVRALLEGARTAEQACSAFDHSGPASSGVWLGAALGELALQRRDKLTFVVGGRIASFGLWAEQLVAESTGKQGKGIVPVVGEPVGDPGVYGSDRVFVHLRDDTQPDEELDAKVAALADAGHPTVTLRVHGPEDLGRIFFFAEFATAVAGWVLGINPFDQPNVQEAKDNTKKVLEEAQAAGRVPDEPDADDDALRALFADAEPPAYVAILAFVQPTDGFTAAADELRLALREATRAATTFGYGPRYLHSTGQLHKGGPKTGRFLQLVHDGPGDVEVEVPGGQYTFDMLKNAQAVGDLRTLRQHGLPAERVRLHGDDPLEALRQLTTRIKELLT
jgi:transaldolase/glucose-6-phosphate isomerase